MKPKILNFTKDDQFMNIFGCLKVRYKKKHFYLSKFDFTKFKRWNKFKIGMFWNWKIE
jgi:hypothetical protein